ncbi:MAG: PAS domain S-box protein, partial [Pseudomonadota bacterium]
MLAGAANIAWRREVFDALELDCALLDLRPDGRIAQTTAALPRWLDVRPHDLIDTRLLDHVWPSEGMEERFSQNWRDVVAGRARTVVLGFKQSDANEVWVAALLCPDVRTGRTARRITFIGFLLTRHLASAMDAVAHQEAIEDIFPAVEFDVSGNVVRASSKFRNMVGYADHELTNATDQIFLPHDDPMNGSHGRLWTRALDGQPAAGRVKWLSKDGRDLWLDANMVPVKGRGNVTRSILTYALDVTSEVISNADSKGRLSAIESSMIVVEYDLEGTFLNTNDLFLDLTGYKPADVIGTHHSSLLDVTDRQSADYRRFWDDLSRGGVQSGRYRMIRKDGSELWLAATYNPIIGPNGRPVKIVKYAQDVTETVLKEQQFKLLSDVADYTSNSVLITDSHGVTIYANNGFERSTGYSAQDIIGHKPGAILQGPLTDRDTVAYMSQKLAEQRPYKVDVLNYKSDGTPHWIALSVDPILSPSGQLQGFVSIQAEITETKHAAIDSSARITAVAQANIVLEWNADGQLIDANDRALRVLDARSVDELHEMYPTALENFIDAVESTRLMRDEISFLTRELSFTRRDGRTSSCLGTLTPLFDINRQISRIVLYGVDVSKQHAAAKQISNVLGEIDQTAQTISSISERTNLLALNASIEA